MNRIRKDLTEALPHVKSDEGLLCGRYCFQIAQKEQGLVWTKTPSKEHASQMFGSIPKIVVDSLQVTSFSKVGSNTIVTVVILYSITLLIKLNLLNINCLLIVALKFLSRGDRNTVHIAMCECDIFVNK